MDLIEVDYADMTQTAAGFQDVGTTLRGSSAGAADFIGDTLELNARTADQVTVAVLAVGPFPSARRVRLREGDALELIP